ncbi:nuclear pore glycoprotein p62 [Neodiprion virginianus]|uniref:nuclear pore glycoprotein p62 n=1 Tax=Neodiprion fabricii TaxID=2872261 RepID=UPI001ED981BC|nr:nuclear pore glycoprotein p62 [Neodiprion fabricii]XP_046620923.1 nuclear pore glycoprotein p62 [Neodiprion virginianus]
MNYTFGAQNPNTQAGFTPGTTAPPVTGGAQPVTFGTSAVGAGDANKQGTLGLAQPGGHPLSKSIGQAFSTSFGTATFGASPATAPAFGTPSSGTTGFARSGSGLMGLATPQQQAITASSLPAANTAAPAGALTYGTPISAATTTNASVGFRTTTLPNTSSGLGTLAMPSSTPGLSFGAKPMTTSALTFNLASTAATSGQPPASNISFGVPKTVATTTIARPAGQSFTVPAASTPASGFTTGVGTTPAATSATGFSLFNTPQIAPSTAVAPTATATPTASAASGFNLPGSQTQAAKTTGTSLGLGSMATIAPATAATGFSTGTPASSGIFTLGSMPSVTAAASFNSGGTTTVASTPGFTLAKSTDPAASTAAPTSAPQTSLETTTNVTASTAATSQPGGLNFCQLEESINKWTLELEEQEKAFVNQATQVNAWDRLLIANGEKIVTLNQEVERVKLEQEQLEHELDYVVGQQRELQDCLVPLEKELATVSASDPEREYTYRLAENLDTQLKQMSEDLKEIIEHLNEANRSQDSSDPIVQIGKILNAHMNSLQWLDQRTSVLQTKIQQIDQMHQNFRQEHERSFNLAYN